MMRRLLVLLVVMTTGIANAEEAGMNSKDRPAPFVERLENARAEYDGAVLRVSTGNVRRDWKLTPNGLVTTSVVNEDTGKTWAAPSSQRCDWMISGLIDNDSTAELLSLTAEASDDEAFTSEHLNVTAHFRYADTKLDVKHTIWAYPDAPGLRTALSVKALEGFDAEAYKEKAIADRADFLPVSTVGKSIEAIGYFSGTQGRNRRGTLIIKEAELPEAGRCGWASVLAVKDGTETIFNVKESHKCPNTPHGGANTGSFNYGANGIGNTGLGLVPAEFVTDRFRNCWAAWTILAQGSEAEQQLTFKQFDRIRYPIDPKRDIYLMANTWGSTISRHDGQHAAREDNILAEINSQADLGIDIQQIDDGWQGTDYNSWRPVPQNIYAGGTAMEKRATYAVYPEGWKNVKQAARDAGVRLGLWAAWTISADDLIWNYDNGGFLSYKLDFAHLTTMDLYETLMGKARALISHSKHKVRINWDVTEAPPRVGYFAGREYGNIYLENRKPVSPAHVVYKPYLVLRDAWHIAKHLNLNKFQITVQNVDLINREVSDAWKHRHDYALAQTLMGCPIFFQETHYYTEDARKQLRPLIATYKKVRNEMYAGYVFPIGDEPDNQSWSGFQNHNPETGRGFVTILRQIENEESRKPINLNFLAGKQITLTDLVDGTEREPTVSKDGTVDFSIPNAGGFAFVQYEVQGSGN
jgi:hypothetical protein